MAFNFFTLKTDSSLIQSILTIVFLPSTILSCATPRHLPFLTMSTPPHFLRAGLQEEIANTTKQNTIRIGKSIRPRLDKANPTERNYFQEQANESNIYLLPQLQIPQKY